MTRGLLLISSALALAAAPVRAQSGGVYALSRNTIAGGGGTFSSGGSYRLGGTIGQSDAGAPLAAGVYVLRGGFWPGVVGSAPATPTPTRSVTRTVTRTGTAVASPTPTRATATPSGTRTATPTTRVTEPPTPTPTGPTATIGSPTGSPTSTPTSPPTCVGDCDDSGTVAVNELIVGVNILLDRQPIDACRSFDANGSGNVTVDELVRAVNNTLQGCP